jgi:hypothetical protein
VTLNSSTPLLTAFPNLSRIIFSKFL